MPAATHPIWACLLGLLLVGVLWLRLAYGYENGFDPTPDIKTILSIIGTYFGAIGAKMLFTGKRGE